MEPSPPSSSTSLPTRVHTALTASQSQFVAGFRGLSTYKAPNLQFDCQVVYTNKPAPGAYRGYGAVPGPVCPGSHMEEIAVALGMDPIEFKRINWVKEGDEITMAKAMGEGREGFEQFVTPLG